MISPRDGFIRIESLPLCPFKVIVDGIAEVFFGLLYRFPENVIPSRLRLITRP